MATKKDLVEAHAFSRRRLVTAFLSGAPGGREVEPSRPGRTIVGGIALSVLLIAGAAIASVLASRTPADWQKPGIIVAQGGASATYVILDPDDPVLHPMLNSTSAQLIYGADAESTSVSRETLDQQTPDTTLGIFNAPPDLPQTSAMINTGWTACTGDGLGIRINVASEPDVQPGTGYGFTVVTPDGSYYLIAVGADDGGPPRARYFAVSDVAASDSMLDDLGVGAREEALSVPASWVRLFEPGGALTFESFGVDLTQPLPGALRQVPGASTGAFVETAGGEGQLLTAGGIVPLTPFALAVYRRTVLPGTSNPPVELPEGTTLPNAAFPEQVYDRASWPTNVITQQTPVRQACAVLTATRGERPGVRLGIEPGDDATASAELEATEARVRVQPGGGAFFYSGGFTQSTGGEAYVLNSQGNVYNIVDTESIEQLGYDEVQAPVVPDTWTDLFFAGVDLSTSAALCPPVNEGEAGDQACERPGDGATDTAGAG